MQWRRDLLPKCTYVQLHRVIPEWSWGYVHTKRDSDWESAADRSLHHTINTFVSALTHTHTSTHKHTHAHTTHTHAWLEADHLVALWCRQGEYICISVCVCVIIPPVYNIIMYILTSTGLLGNFCVYMYHVYCNIIIYILGIRIVHKTCLAPQSCSNLWTWKTSNNKEGICEMCEYT